MANASYPPIDAELRKHNPRALSLYLLRARLFVESRPPHAAGAPPIDMLSFMNGALRRPLARPLRQRQKRLRRTFPKEGAARRRKSELEGRDLTQTPKTCLLGKSDEGGFALDAPLVSASASAPRRMTTDQPERTHLEEVPLFLSAGLSSVTPRL